MVAVRVRDPLLAKLETHCDERQETYSSVVREALRKFFEGRKANG